MAATQFRKTEWDALTKTARECLVFSGMAGQWYAGTGSSNAHFDGDRKWLLADWDLDVDRASGGGIELLPTDEQRFARVNAAALRGLAEGAEYVPREDLLAE